MVIKVNSEAIPYIKNYLKNKKGVIYAYLDYFVNYTTPRDVTIFANIANEKVIGAGLLYNTKWILTLFGNEEGISKIFLNAPQHPIIIRIPLKFKKLLIKLIHDTKFIIKRHETYNLMKVTPKTFSPIDRLSNGSKMKVLSVHHAEDLARLYLYGQYTQNDIESFKRLLMTDKSTFGIEYDSKIVSACRIPIKTKHTWIISNVQTLLSYRRRGFATSLVSEVVKFAFDRGVRRVALTVNTENRTAKNIYKKLGFRSNMKLYALYII